MMPKQTARGFTLIEVMIALLVVAVALSAMLVRIQGIIDNTAYLRDKTLASWVALNQLELVRLTNQANSSLVEKDMTGVEEMANRRWVWRIEPEQTEAEGFQQITVKVADAEDADNWLVSLNAYLDSYYALP